MSVALLISDDTDIPQLLRWTVLFAYARQTDIVLLHSVAQSGSNQISQIDLTTVKKETTLDVVERVRDTLHNNLNNATLLSPKQETDNNNERDVSWQPQVSMKILYGSQLTMTLAELTANNIDLLVIPRHAPLPEQQSDHSLERQLFNRTPCETLLLKTSESNDERCQEILVACAQGPHSRAALRLADDLSKSHSCQITALYVEPEVGIDAEPVGLRILDRIITRALSNNSSEIKKRVVIANKINVGISAACQEHHDLLLVGESKHGLVRRILFNTIPDDVLNNSKGLTIGVVRASIPISNRFGSAIERFLQARVPQLEREHRVALVERVQSNSQWEFDFILLIGLSTLIAALGLIQNSTAVVIGAMLVAPLMTPLLGIGLALVQGN